MESYIKKKYAAFLFGLVVILPVILQYAVFANSVESNASNDGWASFLGSYIGGVFGGGMTLMAVLISVRETRRIQQENYRENSLRAAKDDMNNSVRLSKMQQGNNLLQKRKERIAFCNEIAELVGRYCADISKYFYDCKFRTGGANRIVSIECLFTLSIKLKNIDAAKNLIDELNAVHNEVLEVGVDLDYITEATSKLMDITAKFINSYVDEVDLTSF